MRRRFSWTGMQLSKLNKVLKILEEQRDYLPLTLRQIYYQMVGKEYIENTRSQYIALSRLIKWARIDGHIRWAHIEDRTRTIHSMRGWDDSHEFISWETKDFLRGYRRDRMQSQDKYIEIWIEKDALSSIFRKISDPYCISVVVCRGFSSVSFLNDFKERLEQQGNRDPLMLYFGDFDPSGKEMLPAMETTLRDEMDAPEVEFKRIALTPEQIEEHNLPHNPQALKQSDTRAQKHIEKYGYLAVELDALRPDTLVDITIKAIENEIDMDSYRDEQDIEEKELISLAKRKEKVTEFLFKG